MLHSVSVFLQAEQATGGEQATGAEQVARSQIKVTQSFFFEGEELQNLL